MNECVHVVVWLKMRDTAPICLGVGSSTYPPDGVRFITSIVQPRLDVDEVLLLLKQAVGVVVLPVREPILSYDEFQIIAEYNSVFVGTSLNLDSSIGRGKTRPMLLSLTNLRRRPVSIGDVIATVTDAVA